MRTSFAAACLIVAIVSHPLKEANETEVPVLPSAWHADGTMLIDGSETKRVQYDLHIYNDYPRRRRNTVEGVDTIIDFEQAKVFEITNGGLNCCWIDNHDSQGNPAKMPQVGPNKNYVDEGPKDGGEGWIFEMSSASYDQIHEFILASDNTILLDHSEYHRSNYWHSSDTTYTNTVVGELTDEQFLTSITSTCSVQCQAPVKSFIESSLRWVDGEMIPTELIH